MKSCIQLRYDLVVQHKPRSQDKPVASQQSSHERATENAESTEIVTQALAQKMDVPFEIAAAFLSAGGVDRTGMSMGAQVQLRRLELRLTRAQLADRASLTEHRVRCIEQDTDNEHTHLSDLQAVASSLEGRVLWLTRHP